MKPSRPSGATAVQERTDLPPRTGSAIPDAPAREVPQCGPDTLDALMALAQSQGGLYDLQLDTFLGNVDEFDDRRDALIETLGDQPLWEHPIQVEQRAQRFGIPTLGDDDSLRRYLRQVTSNGRMNKAQESALAKRLEVARERFERAVHGAQVQGGQLRDVLGDEYSRSYEQDLDLPGGSAVRLDGDHRSRVQDRAAELNRMRSEFVERCLALVVDVVLAYRTYGVPVMDLVQEGNGALIRAVEKFDWRKDVRFQTYATFWIRQAIERSIAFNKGMVRVPNYLQQKMRRLRREGVLSRNEREVSVLDVSKAFAVKPEIAGHLLQTERAHFSLDVASEEGGETFAAALVDETAGVDARQLEAPLLQQRLEEVLAELPALEREILEYRFGLAGRESLTLEEVGRRMSVSRERIRQLQVRAIRKLQRPGLIAKLAGFV